MALGFVATVDEYSRFDGTESLSSDLGLIPRRHQSGDVDRRGRITKAGPGWMRWLLVQAAWSMYRSKGEHELVQWTHPIEKRRGKNVAIVALARKIAATMFGLLRHPGSTYEPSYRSTQRLGQQAAA